MHKTKFVLALIVFNLAVFIGASLFLPTTDVFSYSNPLSYYINSRRHWHLALGTSIVSLLISWSLYLVFSSFVHPPQKTDQQHAD
ncbi:MAG: hypothetical protein VX438_16695 [Planctomycetota bacterium]|nr:hypothetical protein [Planctomycetota bacterium]